MHPYGRGRFSEDNGRSALGRVVLTQSSSLRGVIDRQPQRGMRPLMLGIPGPLRWGSGLLPEALDLDSTPNQGSGGYFPTTCRYLMPFRSHSLMF